MIECTIRISRPLAWSLIVGAVAVTAILTAGRARVHRPDSASRTAPASVPPRLANGPENPWGRLVVSDILLDVPEEFIQMPDPDAPPLRWHFPGMTRDDVLALLSTTDLPPGELDRFARSDRWFSEDGGVALEPADPMVLHLTRGARSVLYPRLIRAAINQTQMDPVWFRENTFAAQLKDCDLRPDAIRLLKSLLYTQDNCQGLLFADRQVALRQLPDDRERALFLKMLARKHAVRVHLALDERSDIDELATYWGVGGRRKDILPLLRSLQRSDGPREISVVSLMPRFIRERVWTYPFPSSNPNLVRQDCFWTAFNTFNETPDDRLADMAYLRGVLDRDYYSLTQPSQLGDVILLTTPSQEAVHAAVYIAGDIVFTKNGYHYSQPWIFTRMNSMLETYLARYPGANALVPQYFRRKGL